MTKFNTLSLTLFLLLFALPSVLAGEQDQQATSQVNGTFVLPKEIDSFDGHTVEIRLYKIHPLVAGKAADLVELVEMKDFAHRAGTETKKDFVIGAKSNLDKELKYYLTLFIIKDGARTHMGGVPGKFLCTVLTMGAPNEVTLTVKQLK